MERIRGEYDQKDVYGDNYHPRPILAFSDR